MWKSNAKKNRPSTSRVLKRQLIKNRLFHPSPTFLLYFVFLFIDLLLFDSIIFAYSINWRLLFHCFAPKPQLSRVNNAFSRVNFVREIISAPRLRFRRRWPNNVTLSQFIRPFWQLYCLFVYFFNRFTHIQMSFFFSFPYTTKSSCCFYLTFNKFYFLIFLFFFFLFFSFFFFHSFSSISKISFRLSSHASKFFLYSSLL